MASRNSQEPIYLMAFDHRGSFEKDLFGIDGNPDPALCARISAAKGTIFAGFELALTRGAPTASAGVLVDEEFGAEIARAAKAGGNLLAMPVELSGQPEFVFQYPDWQAHIDRFGPDLVKVLVRCNPEGDRELNARQAARLRQLSDWLAQRDEMRFLFELLVPPTAEQLVGGGQDRFDHELRPALVIRTIAELQDAGVEPDIWKIEGIYRVEDCELVARQARDGGRDDVRCIVLGRGADEALVETWLRVGAAADGFAGFAVGRTIWLDALKAMLAGEIDEHAAAGRIADLYMREIDVYVTAAKEAAR